MNICQTCGCERHPVAKPGNCQSCHSKLKREQYSQDWSRRLIELNFDIVQFDLSKGIHSKVTVTNKECGHTFTAKLNNILNKATICGICGPTKRMKFALNAYIEKYGRKYDLTKWRDYLGYVRQITDELYFSNPSRFNPDNLPRTRADLHKDAVNLDHIIPIIYGFKNSIAPEIIADARNLRILPARKNLSKKQKLTEEGEILLKELLSIK